MATMVLSAAGASLGASIGGSILGISAAALGQAAGAAVGGLIDQRLQGQQHSHIERGRIDSFRLQSSAEGGLIPRVMGRTRIAGQMIWSSDFIEHLSSDTSGGGKFNTRPKVTTDTYSYSVNVAFLLCEGEMSKIGRIWADGQEVPLSQLKMRIYKGTQDQEVDDLIAAYEGIENTPAFRGSAYVVIEDLNLAEFGNRIPHFNFEVFRRPNVSLEQNNAVTDLIQAVALIPGSGEYVLATEPVRYENEFAHTKIANVNTSRGDVDFIHSIDDLNSELPNCKSVSLVVTWFGNDLRCSECELTPRVEFRDLDGTPMPWVVSGLERQSAQEVSREDGNPVFGGTPADKSILQAIEHIKSKGQDVVFYPFILMDIQNGNGLPDPYGWSVEQPAVPWRGRITCSKAPNHIETVDRTAVARSEIESFFGSAKAQDFQQNVQSVDYTGENEWSYSRFVLHYAHLCAMSGGVGAFVLGSELRGLTLLRDQENKFPFVEKLVELAAEVKVVLGEGTKVSYAADWSEYFGYQPADGSGDIYFNLDPLWASENIDFIGIDNYVPISDWRNDESHLDREFESIYNQKYLKSNIEGGEGYDWYYASDYDRDSQNRAPISDGAYGEDWIYRYKDFKNWWKNLHYNRIGGVKSEDPTAWEVESKPIWFTEIGFPAVDMGTNQPNVFVDSKSSENALPHYSNGQHDPQIQTSALRAVIEYWSDDENNPVSGKYLGPMIDVSKAHVWTWDARPWPDFPYRDDIWSDGANYSLGHWITGRMGGAMLSHVVAELCEYSGVYSYDVSELHDWIVGIALTREATARQNLQVLMSAYDFDCFEQAGVLVFQPNCYNVKFSYEPNSFCIEDEINGEYIQTKTSSKALPDSVGIGFWDPTKDYQYSLVESRNHGGLNPTSFQTDFPLALSKTEAVSIANRILRTEGFNADELQFSLPPSESELTVGDIVEFTRGDNKQSYRVKSIEEQGLRNISAVLQEPKTGGYIAVDEEESSRPSIVPANAVYAKFLELPQIDKGVSLNAPYVAITADPWPNGAAIYSSIDDEQFKFEYTARQRAIIGKTQNELGFANPFRLANQGFSVRISNGVLTSISHAQLLQGQNRLAIGHSGFAEYEILQFQNAVLQQNGTYLVSRLLRGQFGTDAFIPEAWPIGSDIYLLDDAIGQPDFEDLGSGIVRNLRIGPIGETYNHPTYQPIAYTEAQIPKRPYSVAHLQARMTIQGEVFVEWIRRSRVLGEFWDSIDIALGEVEEAYRVRIYQANEIIREEYVIAPRFHYSKHMQNSDEISGEIHIGIAQLSEDFGPGPETRKTIHV